MGKQKICGPFLLNQRKISSRLPQREIYFFARPPRRTSRKEESKLFLCGFSAAADEIYSFFHVRRGGQGANGGLFASWRLCATIFFTQIKKEKNADRPLGKQKICGSFLLNQREKKSRPKQRGIESSPLRLSCFAALRDYFFFLRPPRRTKREMEEGLLKT